MISRFGNITAALLIFTTLPPLTMGQHSGRVVLMKPWIILIFDDQRIQFDAGMLAGDFFGQLERRKTAKGELFYIHSKSVSDYPKSVTVRLFANRWERGDTPFDKRWGGTTSALMDTLQFKAEWKTGLDMRPVSKMAVRHLERNEIAANVLSAYELTISSEGVPLTDHLVVSVYGPASSLVVRFSGSP